MELFIAAREWRSKTFPTDRRIRVWSGGLSMGRVPPIWRDAGAFQRAASTWRARQPLSGTRHDLLRKTWWHRA
ncbi:hypothetical protein [Streptomyces sp. NRRL S-337]|uniref:hypothetical protein n=1 Tax=Streptomyces sp. NRRL S-337 TaxID=1463900 RepID=UPI002D218840|nr:hypothetical protein [Streptomyces sp. NRRL S-337]